MADKEIRIPYSRIANPQTITDVNKRAFNSSDQGCSVQRFQLLLCLRYARVALGVEGTIRL